jgi:LuxR family transcriptional regulator, maltose regulon positive regulatory protein
LDLPLLTTKLFAPPPRPSLVARPHLLARLDEALSPACRLALLSAPAGFGKTTLVSEWCESLAKRGVPLAWLTLDAEDNRPARLLHYLAAAVQRIYPEVGRSAQALLDQPQALPIESVLTSLINELAGLPGDFVLVLDDYHTLNGQAVHPAMAFLLEHHPPQMHLLILTRQDPLLPLARLRAGGQVVELRAADLRFSADEAAAFLKEMLGGAGLSAGQIERLEAHTEGWVAGLQMAALSMRGRQDVDAFLAAFSGGHQFIFEYLTEEVLAQLEQPVRDFLYQTAFLERLCAPLVDAITGRDDSQAMLNRMEQANLFLTALDDQGIWYRYHPLFADFLRRGKTPAAGQAGLAGTLPLAERRRRAAGWFEANGLLQEAVGQALAAKDFDYAGRLIVQAGDAMFRSAIGGLLAWLEALPAELVRGSCELSTYQGWALLMSNRIDVSLACAEAAQAAIRADTSAAGRGRLLGLQAYLAHGLGKEEQALEQAARAVTLLGEAAPMFRCMLLTLMGQVYRQVGSTAEAEKSLRAAVRIGEQLGYNLGYYVAQANLAWIMNIRGQRRQALDFCQQALGRCVDEGGRELPLALFIYLPLAGIYYDGNQLAEARRCLERGFELCAQLGFNPIVVGGRETMAGVLHAEGHLPAALAFARETSQLAQDFHLPWIMRMAASVEATLLLWDGQVNAAERLVQEAQLSASPQPTPDQDFTSFCLARLLIARGKLDEAGALLERLLASARQGGRCTAEITTCILLAKMKQQAGEAGEARRWIVQALQMAAPAGYLRAFLDELSIDDFRLLIADLGIYDFRLLIDDFVIKEFINKLNQAFGLQSSILSSQSSISNPQSAIAEPLTPRELEVLQLMAGGLSNAEIARKLYLTVNTLKAHTNSIYGKLDVHSRMQAVNLARKLGILG